MRTNRRRKIRSADRQRKLVALAIVPTAQVDRNDYELADVANHSDADQRHMVRSGEKKTIRRKTNVQKLFGRGAITAEQMPVLQWYADQFEMGYSTVGCTANYMGAGGGGFGSSDLFARYAEQAQARDNYRMARDSVPPTARHVLERVVLDHGNIGRDRITFRLAVLFLDKAVGHLVGGQ